ncbi:MAG: hypothetical protein H7Y20_11495 [Bryobacteraceae bacterium]|nr:hypothetical protein [Bryobacteraceae bacterium]
MAQVILFGGGDGGGIIIGPNGVRPIPPFDPAILLQLRGISAIAQAAYRMGADAPGDLQPLVNKLTNIAIEQVEAQIGPLDSDHSIVYQDADGGFTCGSTGKPPIPFPWPPVNLPSVRELIAGGVIDAELVDFVEQAVAKGSSPGELLENPAKIAATLGAKLSERTAKQLQLLAPSRIEKIRNPVDREVVGFFHKVVEDGRFVGSWTTRPFEVARNLDYRLSDSAMDLITSGLQAAYVSPLDKNSLSPVAVGVIVAVVIMLVPTEAGHTKLSVVDLSGVAKF